MTDWTACSCGHLGVMHATDGPCSSSTWGGDCECGAFEGGAS